jgi:hypothetical protein
LTTVKFNILVFTPLLTAMLGAVLAHAQPRYVPDASAAKPQPVTAPVVPPPAPAASDAPPATPANTPSPAAQPSLPAAPTQVPHPVLAPSSVHSGVMAARVAISEFKVDGDGASPAMAMQLQDGFVVGLTRSAPIYVLDTVDVARYTDSFPELQKCDGSICIKRFGQLLDVSHLIRVSVKVTGNSYTMTARLLSTEEQTHAVVPLDTETRFCNVCTVDEARQRMVQLGDELRRPVEHWLATWRPPPPLPPPPKSWRRPVAAVGIALSFAAAVSGGAIFANSKNPGNRWKPALGGLLVGLGLSGTVLGCYVLVALPSEPGKSMASLTFGSRF